MSNRIKISMNKHKILDGINKNEKILVIKLCLILYYSLLGRSKSVSLQKIFFVYDSAAKFSDKSKSEVLISRPWGLDYNIKKSLILAESNNLIKIILDGSSVKVLLEDKGAYLIDRIIKEGYFFDLNEMIKNTVKSATDSSLKKQNLSW